MREIEKIVRKFTPNVTVHNEGAELAIACPFHSNRHARKKQLWLSVAKRVFICYRCGESGTLHKLFLKMKALRPSALSGVDPNILGSPVLIVPEREEDEEHEVPALTLPKEYRPLWKSPLSRFGKQALAYFQRRGFTLDHAELYQVGYCVDGYYSYRLIIPTYENEKLVYFVARDFTGQQDKKVLNPRKESGEVVGSKECVFGLDLAAPFPKVYIHEGVFDAMATGLTAVALFGKTASKAQIEKIADKHFNEIVVCLDADAHGDTAKLAHQIKRGSTVPLTGRNGELTEIRGATLRRGDPATSPAKKARQYGTL